MLMADFSAKQFNIVFAANPAVYGDEQNGQSSGFNAACSGAGRAAHEHQQNDN